MGTRLVEGLEPYREGTGIEITDDGIAKYINVKLRALNNLIICNDDNELYTDLQLEDGLNANDEVPVGVLTGRVLQADGWPQTGTLLSWKTTSGDLNQFLWGNDGNLYFRDGNGVWHILTFQDGTYKCAVISDDGQGNVSLSMQYLALAQALAQDADSINWLFQNRGSTGQIHIEIVAQLPATGSSDTIYFVSDGQGGYDEYIWDAANNTWINVGGISVDLSNYVDKSTNQTIGGQKTFLLEPVLPSKSSIPTNNPTSPATEAQLFNLAQDLANKQDKLTAGDGIDIDPTTNVISIYSTPATQGQVLTKGANGVEWTTPQGGGQTYNSGVGIDIDANNDINIDTTGASTGDVLKKTNNGVGWDTIKEFEPSNTGTSGQVLKRDSQGGYSWENESGGGGGGGGTTYYAGDGISIDSSHNISIDKTGATQGQVMSVDGQGNIVWINQSASNRIFYARDDSLVMAYARTVSLVDPSTMQTLSTTYTAQAGDIIFVWFNHGCKIGGDFKVKDPTTGIITTYTATHSPELNINNNGLMPIYVRNNLADYYHFHIGQDTWIMFMYDGVRLNAINTEEVADVYEGEAWRLVECIREMNKNYGGSVSQSEYTALVNTGTVDPDVWYHVHADQI